MYFVAVLRVDYDLTLIKQDALTQSCFLAGWLTRLLSQACQDVNHFFIQTRGYNKDNFIVIQFYGK